MNTMKRRVRKYIEEHGMIRPGDTVVAGVSGGADSLCLFLLLHELSEEIPFHLHVVHVHHGLRLSAQGDLDFVKNLCEQKQVPCTVIYVDAGASARQWGTGIEEAGRRLRYDAFRQVCDSLREQNKDGERGGSFFRIAVAHHREDQAETVLFHLCRGTDLRGARGMLPVNGEIIRPLLCESRACIEQYLTEKGFSWQEDETNSDTGYTRNFIRREILPRLEEGVHVSAAQRISQFAAACAEAETYLSGLTARALERCTAECLPDDRILFSDSHVCIMALSLSDLRKEDPYLQGRILYRCLADSTVDGKDIGTVHVEGLRSLCSGKPGGQLSMPSRVTVFKSGEKLFFCREKDGIEKTGQMDLREQAGTYPLSEEEYVCSVRDFDGSVSAIPRNEYTNWFDYDKIGMFPVFRTRQPGDCMHLFSDGDSAEDLAFPADSGMTEDVCLREKDRKLIRKKLARIMLDGKIPAGIRDKIVLPYSGNEVLWIPGLRMGDSFRVTSATKRLLEIRWRSSGFFPKNNCTAAFYGRGEKDGI